MYDFLIIGGGIAGVSAAARLAPHGSVLLLEAEDALGYHASGRSAAMFEESYGKASTIALNKASKAHHETAHGGVLSPRGLMLLGSEDHAAFEADLTALQLHEIGLDEALAMLPILDQSFVQRVGYHAEAWDIDTDLLLQNYARDCRKHGGEIRPKAPVAAISRLATGWQVRAAGEVFDGRILINAAGAWADPVAELAGIAPIGITPHRRSMAQIPAPGGHDVNAWPMLFGPGENWYAKPQAGKLLVSPADEDPVEPHDAWADDLTLAEGLARYERHVTESVTRVETSWAGLRSFAPDRQLVLGPEPSEPSFVWCAGQGGYGMQTSPAASQFLADLLTGATPEIDAATVALLLPDRLR